MSSLGIPLETHHHPDFDLCAQSSSMSPSQKPHTWTTPEVLTLAIIP